MTLKNPDLFPQGSIPQVLADQFFKFAERFDKRFWRVLNEPTSDDVYISRAEALEWQAEISKIVAGLLTALRSLPPQTSVDK